jgi:hypothetical protein
MSWRIGFAFKSKRRGLLLPGVEAAGLQRGAETADPFQGEWGHWPSTKGFAMILEGSRTTCFTRSRFQV